MARTEQELIKLTKQLIAVESTAVNPKGLKEAYNFVADMIKASGQNDITIEPFIKDGVRSFLAYKGPRRPDNFRVIFNAHLDVVPGKEEQFKPSIKNGKLYGRGAYDIKAAAVIMTDLFCEYVNQVPYALGLQITTDEESAGRRGTGFQVSQGVRADFAICAECGRLPSDYEIANEAKGVAIVDIEFAGKSAHGAYLWRGENAILSAVRFTEAIIKRYPVPTDEAAHTTVNVSSIGTSNTAFSSVPDHASLRLEIRFTSNDPNFRSQQHMAALIEEIDPNAVIAEVQCFDAPLYTNPQNPLLRQLKSAAEQVEGHEFKLVRRNGTSDGRFYGNVGDQACEFGPAGKNQHGNNEHITLDAFRNYKNTLELFLQNSIKTEAENTNTKAFIAR